MNKLKIFLVSIIMIVIPFMVNAKECNIDDLIIESISENYIEGNLIEVSNPTISSHDINLNLKMTNVGDSIGYKLVLKNTSKEEY